MNPGTNICMAYDLCAPRSGMRSKFSSSVLVRFAIFCAHSDAPVTPSIHCKPPNAENASAPNPSPCIAVTSAGVAVPPLANNAAPPMTDAKTTLKKRSQSDLVQSFIDVESIFGSFSAFARMSSPLTNFLRNFNTARSSAWAYRVQSSPTRFARCLSAARSSARSAPLDTSVSTNLSTVNPSSGRSRIVSLTALSIVRPTRARRSGVHHGAPNSSA